MKWFQKATFGGVALATVMAATTAWAAPQTWTGVISDAMCAGKHGGDAKQCTEKCVKGGEKYVLVVTDADKKSKVYAISNQKFADLAKYAGEPAVVTGELGKDDSITISKMAAPKK